jgi:uncharacterized membrane protein
MSSTKNSAKIGEEVPTAVQARNRAETKPGVREATNLITRKMRSEYLIFCVIAVAFDVIVAVFAVFCCCFSILVVLLLFLLFKQQIRELER